MTNKRLFRLVFNYFEKYDALPCDDQEAYWCAAAAELGQVAAELNNDPFALDLLAAIYQELERRKAELR